MTNKGQNDLEKRAENSGFTSAKERKARAIAFLDEARKANLTISEQSERYEEKRILLQRYYPEQFQNITDTPKNLGAIFSNYIKNARDHDTGEAKYETKIHKAWN